MTYKLVLKTRASVREFRCVANSPRLRWRIRTALVRNELLRHVRQPRSSIPINSVLTYRFDNLLSSKKGPSGTQALQWDGQNVATASGPASVGIGAPATCEFVGTDTTTQGNWQTLYGFDGYNVIQSTFRYPVYAAVSETGTSNNTWSTTTTDPRALYIVTGRIAADW